MLTESLTGLVRTYMPFLGTHRAYSSVFDIPPEEEFVLTWKFAKELIESGQPEEMTKEHVGHRMAFYKRKIGKSPLLVLWDVSLEKNSQPSIFK